MVDRNPFEAFDFNRRRTRIPPILVIEAIGVAGLLALWWLLPSNVLLCLLLPLLAVLIWAASFGWRRALSQLIEFLQTLEDRSFGGF